MWGKGRGCEEWQKGQGGNYDKIVVRGILFHLRIDDRNVISKSVKSFCFAAFNIGIFWDII